MRQALILDQVTIPNYKENIPHAAANLLNERFREWTASDFAGFRRLLEKGSAEYPDLQAIKALAENARVGSTGKPVRNFVLLGTGGSSLGAEALVRSLRSSHTPPYFHFMDNNDPQWFSWLLQSLSPEETLFYVVSKSGKTPETISQFLTILEWLQKNLSRKEDWKKHVVLSTDPEKGDLRAIANRFELPCLDIPPAVGGRFSVLTSVGLFPAAFAGLNPATFLSGARSFATEWEDLPITEHPAAKLASALARCAKEKPITVCMPYSSQLGAFSRWFCQLWAESLGKNNKGLTPFPAIGTTDQHSQMQLYMEGPTDKTILFVHLREKVEPLPLADMEGAMDLPSFRELSGKSMQDLFEAEFQATRDALTNREVPNATIELDRLDEYSLGALFYFCELLTLYAGAHLKINPFDQPGVEAAKILTKRYLLGLGRTRP